MTSSSFVVATVFGALAAGAPLTRIVQAGVQGRATTLPLQAAAWATISDPARFPLGNDAAGRLTFDFPSSGSINYLYYSSSPRTIAGTVSIAYTITMSGPVLFNYRLEASNTCATPATVRAFFWANGEGEGEFDRWWSNPVAQVLAAGSRTLTVPLSPDWWSSVFGKLGNVNAAAMEGFNKATRSVSRLDLTFGGGCFFGHGVNVRGGTARFALIDYSIG
jgi:hypothetical protein